MQDMFGIVYERSFTCPSDTLPRSLFQSEHLRIIRPSIPTDSSLTKVSSSCQSAIDHVKEQLSGKLKDYDFALGLQNAIESLVKEQITGLLDAVRNSEADARTAAHLLTAATRVAGSLIY